MKLLKSVLGNVAEKAVIYSLQNLLSDRTIQTGYLTETDLGIRRLLTDQFAY